MRCLVPPCWFLNGSLCTGTAIFRKSEVARDVSRVKSQGSLATFEVQVVYLTEACDVASPEFHMLTAQDRI